MNYFLAKTDPDTYCIDDFEKERTTVWDGVHNNAALLFMQQMKIGDLVYIYQSMSSKAIMALAEVTSEPELNKNDPRRSWIVTMKFIKRYANTVTLAQIKAEPELADFKLVRESRLSVMPVPPSIASKLNAMLGQS
jgi:predicted RNA-binding protein with PUA-like domain